MDRQTDKHLLFKQSEITLIKDLRDHSSYILVGKGWLVRVRVVGMGLYGLIRVGIGWYGLIWVGIGWYRLVWVGMGLYGFVWVGTG